MPCRSPATGYRGPDGKIHFASRKNSLGRFGFVTFNCGVCIDCRLQRAQEWAIRCYHESSMHERNCFLTLTFREDPGSICKRDLQLFFKRLRISLPGLDLRYLACGEYGEKFSRPHYHVCLFGYDFPDKIPVHTAPSGNVQYNSPLLDKLWPHGWATIGTLTMESAGYTARYVKKKITGDAALDHYTRDWRGQEIEVTPEFQLQSTRPALGKKWIEKFWPEVVAGHCVIYKGKEKPVPRYYMKWLEQNQPEAHAILVEKNRAHYKSEEIESGLRQHQKSLSRDHRRKKLIRRYEGETPE